jgi:hypothetical protein
VQSPEPPAPAVTAVHDVVRDGVGNVARDVARHSLQGQAGEEADDEAHKKAAQDAGGQEAGVGGRGGTGAGGQGRSIQELIKTARISLSSKDGRHLVLISDDELMHFKV